MSSPKKKGGLATDGTDFAKKTQGAKKGGVIADLLRLLGDHEDRGSKLHRLQQEMSRSHEVGSA